MNLGGLFGGGGSDAAALARRNEKQRQNLINQGTGYINAVFGGGTVPSWNQAVAGQVYDPKQTYYTNPRAGVYQPWKGGDAQHFKGRIRKNRPLYTKGEDQTFTGFTPDFYNNAQNAYINYQLPQLAQQYQDASDAATYGLAKRGLLNSSVADKTRSDLSLTLGRQKLDIADRGRAMSQDVQRQVEAARQNALNNLYQSANPLNSVNDALTAANQIQIPSLIQPLTNAFSNVMNQYSISQMFPSNPTGQGGGSYGYNPYYGLPNMGGRQPAAYY